MENSTSILSDRTQRYGRNCLIIGVVAAVVSFGAANFDGAGLFGITVKERVFWIVLLTFSVWNAGYFGWLMWDDWKGWKRRLNDKEGDGNLPVTSARFVTGLSVIPKKEVTRQGKAYTLREIDPHKDHYVYDAQDKGTRPITVGKTSMRLERNKVLRLYSIDFSVPYLFACGASGIAFYELSWIEPSIPYLLIASPLIPILLLSRL